MVSICHQHGRHGRLPICGLHGIRQEPAFGLNYILLHTTHLVTTMSCEFAHLQRGGSRPQWQLDQGYRKFQDLTDALERNAQAQKQVPHLSPFCCSRGHAVCYGTTSSRRAAPAVCRPQDCRNSTPQQLTSHGNCSISRLDGRPMQPVRIAKASAAPAALQLVRGVLVGVIKEEEVL